MSSSEIEVEAQAVAHHVQGLGRGQGQGQDHVQGLGLDQGQDLEMVWGTCCRSETSDMNITRTDWVITHASTISIQSDVILIDHDIPNHMTTPWKPLTGHGTTCGEKLKIRSQEKLKI